MRAEPLEVARRGHSRPMNAEEAAAVLSSVLVTLEKAGVSVEVLPHPQGVAIVTQAEFDHEEGVITPPTHIHSRGMR